MHCLVSCLNLPRPVLVILKPTICMMVLSGFEICSWSISHFDLACSPAIQASCWLWRGSRKVRMRETEKAAEEGPMQQLTQTSREACMCCRQVLLWLGALFSPPSLTFPPCACRHETSDTHTHTHTPVGSGSLFPAKS